MAEDICEAPQITRVSLPRPLLSSRARVGYQINDVYGRYVVLDTAEALVAARAILADMVKRGIVMPDDGGR